MLVVVALGSLDPHRRHVDAGDLETAKQHFTEELAGWVATQVELAELSYERTRAMEAELRALRAQISPHFIYNSLTAIASFVRTDPSRARELLLEFADFTRYSFRSHGDYTTLAEELKSIERYLLLEQARFGDRLEVTLRVAPEVDVEHVRAHRRELLEDGVDGCDVAGREEFGEVLDGDSQCVDRTEQGARVFSVVALSAE